MAKTKAVAGEDLPRSAFLYAPDPEDTSTWKLPVKHANGEPNLGKLAAAAAALSPGGFRGKKVDIPAADLGRIKRALVNLYKRVGRTDDQIPKHLIERKAADPLPDEYDPTIVNAGGEVGNIEEVEYKGLRGIFVTAIMNSLSQDTYSDHALLTDELKASTELYFETSPVALVHHARPYRGLNGVEIKSPVPYIVGYTVEHEYRDEGIWIKDFLPEPAAGSPPELIRAYNEVKSGEFTGISVGGNFYRDSGLHRPPGFIVDWDLIEHSYCRNGIDQNALIEEVSEYKSLVEFAVPELFTEYKAALDARTSAASSPEPVVGDALPADPELADPAPTASGISPVPGEPADSTEVKAEAAPAAIHDTPLSGMALYTTAKSTVSAWSQGGEPLTISNPVLPNTGGSVFIPTVTTAPSPVQTPHSPLQSNPFPAEEKSNPAPHLEETMAEINPQNASGQPSAHENKNGTGNFSPEVVGSLMARLEALEAEKKAQDLVLETERRDKEAREAAERQAQEIAQQAATIEAEQKAKIEQYTKEALAKYQIVPMGSKFSVPSNGGYPGGVNNVGQNAAVAPRPRYTMAGPVVEEKARVAGGNPTRMIDWLNEVKAGARSAEWLSWSNKYGQEVKSVNMGVPTTPTFSPAGNAGGFALPTQYLEEIVPLLVDKMSIRSLIQTYPASSILLEVPKMATAATRAVVTAEGDAKPKRQFGTDMLSIRLYTIPQIVDVTNQLLNFSRDTAEQIVREQMADSIRMAEFYYALQGSGTGEPYGLIPALTANDLVDPTAFYVIHQGSGTQPTGQAVSASETLPDFVARGINVTQLRYYEPNAMLVHPNLWWKLITTKDNFGRYLVDANLSGIVNSVWGIEVRHTTQLPQGKGVLGDWSKLRMYIAQDVMVDMTQEAGNRWDNNLTGFRIEEMIGLNAEQELRAFTCLDFTTSGVSSS